MKSLGLQNELEYSAHNVVRMLLLSLGCFLTLDSSKLHIRCLKLGSLYRLSSKQRERLSDVETLSLNLKTIQVHGLLVEVGQQFGILLHLVLSQRVRVFEFKHG